MNAAKIRLRTYSEKDTVRLSHTVVTALSQRDEVRFAEEEQEKRANREKQEEAEKARQQRRKEAQQREEEQRKREQEKEEQREARERQERAKQRQKEAEEREKAEEERRLKEAMEAAMQKQAQALREKEAKEVEERRKKAEQRQKEAKEREKEDEKERLQQAEQAAKEKQESAEKEQKRQEHEGRKQYALYLYTRFHILLEEKDMPTVAQLGCGQEGRSVELYLSYVWALYHFYLEQLREWSVGGEHTFHICKNVSSKEKAWDNVCIDRDLWNEWDESELREYRTQWLQYVDEEEEFEHWCSTVREESLHYQDIFEDDVLHFEENTTDSPDLLMDYGEYVEASTRQNVSLDEMELCFHRAIIDKIEEEESMIQKEIKVLEERLVELQERRLRVKEEFAKKN